MTFQQPSSALIAPHAVHKGRRGSPAFPIRNLRRYITLLSQQLAIGASLIVKHPFKKPPVPTWPLHLTLFVAVIQATEAHQEHFVEDICDIRFWLDTFFHYLPKLPQMQIIPFKLPIPAHGRGLGGLLEPLEQAENGHRVLPGQWISDSKVWSRIMHMPLARSAQGSKDPYAAREGEKVILYYHGGGYFICSTATHRELLWRISKATGRRIFGELPECGFDPANVTIAGDSAGGGLTVGLLMYHRDQGMPTPSKAVLLSPWLDLTMSCESWVTNEMDYLPSPPKFEHSFNPISFYCQPNVKALSRHPYISPLLGYLGELPPLLIQCGEAERLRDECVLFTYKAGGCLGSSNRLPFQSSSSPRHQSKHVELDMYPGMVHVFHAIPFLPEANIALERMLDFMQRKESEAEVASLEAEDAGKVSEITTTTTMFDDKMMMSEDARLEAILVEA
ncbi:hypothetical protein BGZ74_011424 [Mortierella antarctica]|nr:hypothetical protein BGZ74_011424 [Mortierella antarctica]